MLSASNAHRRCSKTGNRSRKKAEEGKPEAAKADPAKSDPSKSDGAKPEPANVEAAKSRRRQARHREVEMAKPDAATPDDPKPDPPKPEPPRNGHLVVSLQSGLPIKLPCCRRISLPKSQSYEFTFDQNWTTEPHKVDFNIVAPAAAGWQSARFWRPRFRPWRSTGSTVCRSERHVPTAADGTGKAIFPADAPPTDASGVPRLRSPRHRRIRSAGVSSSDRCRDRRPPDCGSRQALSRNFSLQRKHQAGARAKIALLAAISVSHRSHGGREKRTGSLGADRRILVGIAILVLLVVEHARR